MKKVFCDRCNKETSLNTPVCVSLKTEDGIEFSLDMAGYNAKLQRRLDLCHMCVIQLLRDCFAQLVAVGGEKLLDESRKHF